MTDQERKKWYSENGKLGKSLGYPSCCIAEFLVKSHPEDLKGMKANKNDYLKYKAGCINGRYTGIIPCLFHAKKILSGQITLYSLIKNRDPKFPPFPNY